MPQARASSAALEAAALDQKRFLTRTSADLAAAREDLDSAKRAKERSECQLAERYAAAEEATSRLGELQRELFDAQAKAVPLEFERDRLAREKESLAAQNGWLDGELGAKAKELRDLKALHAAESAKLRQTIDNQVRIVGLERGGDRAREGVIA